MTMAEQAGTEEEVSRPEESQEDNEGLVEIPFEERVMQRLDALETSIRNEGSRWNGIQGIYDKNTASINELRGLFTEEFGSTKKTLGLFEAFIRD